MRVFVSHRVQTFILYYTLKLKRTKMVYMGELLHLDRKIARLKTKFTLSEAK